MSIELWRPVIGFDGYEVSNRGRVRSWKPERRNAPDPIAPRILRHSIDKNGYHKVRLYRDHRPCSVSVCVLVAEAWIGPRPVGLWVLHADGSKTNNTPENLRWGTPKDNSADAIKHGTLTRGESVNTSKLIESDVLCILGSSESHSELARRYGVTPCAIWHIRAGRTWKHVKR